MQFNLTHSARIHLVMHCGIDDAVTVRKNVRLSNPELARMYEKDIIFDMKEAKTGKGLYDTEGNADSCVLPSPATFHRQI